MRHPKAAGHQITWFVCVPGRDGSGRLDRIRHNATMRGTWGWDAACSCGWDSRTGGATRRCVDNRVWDHKWDNKTEPYGIA
jgi:hypothetical protein